MWIVTLLTAFNCFSQTDTNKVVLSDTVARKVVQDLIELDYRRDLDAVLHARIDTMVKLIEVQDSLISLRGVQIDMMHSQLAVSAAEMQAKNVQIEGLERDVQSTSKELTVFKITSVVALIGIIVALAVQ